MRLTELAHQKLAQKLSPGDRAIDATAGNGHDTLFLAQQVQPNGQVFAFDLQERAIESTRMRLADNNIGEPLVELRRGDHGSLMEDLLLEQKGKIQAIVFNLGYLPGSDKVVQTSESTTQVALNASLKLLDLNGVLCVIAYRAHPGGEAEAEFVKDWMRQREIEGHSIEQFIPDSERLPPILWVLQRSLKSS